MGIILGVFIPVQVRQRNYDCQSRMFATCVELIDWVKFYDGPWEETLLNYASYGVKGLRDVWMIASTIDTCVQQSVFSLENQYRVEF